LGFQAHIQSRKTLSFFVCLFPFKLQLRVEFNLLVSDTPVSFLNNLSVQNCVIHVGLEVLCVCLLDFTTFYLLTYLLTELTPS
jgi:hypothetical protein